MLNPLSSHVFFSTKVADHHPSDLHRHKCRLRAAERRSLKVASFLSTLPTPCQLCNVDAQDICFVVGNKSSWRRNNVVLSSFWVSETTDERHGVLVAYLFFFPKCYNHRQLSVLARLANLTEKCRNVISILACFSDMNVHCFTIRDVWKCRQMCRRLSLKQLGS